jgi:hypothetical protein
MAQDAAETQRQLDKTYKQTVVIVSAEIVSVLVLLVVSFLAPARSDIGAAFDSTALMVLIIFIAAASFMVRRLFNRWERYKTAMLLGGSSKLVRTLRNNAVVLAGFGLLIGLIGFIAGTFGGNALDMLRASGVAVIVFAVNFPRSRVWERIVWSLNE